MKYENYIKVILGIMSMTFLIYIGSTAFKRVRVDVTEENIYTLSEGTKSLLKKLDSPIVLKLYYSKTAANKGSEGLRAFNNHFLYIEELLQQFVSNSENNLTLDVIDPRPDTPEEEDAIMYGLKKFNLTETERYFFGLVAENEAGGEKVIEFFDPALKDKVEYDIAKLIYTVLNPKRKNVGVISSMNVISEDLSPYIAQIMRMQGKPVSESWISVQMLREFYNVKKIEKDSETISGIDVLVVIHPKGFPEKTLLAIDQYLMGGGKILVFVDPNAIVDPSGRMTGKLSASPDAGFKKLMEKWGVILIENSFAGDKYLSGVGQFNPNMPPGRLLPLLSCNTQCTDRYKDTITSGIDNATFIFPGVLETKEIKDLKLIPIIGTTDKGNRYRAMAYELNNPQVLWDKFIEGSKPVVFGYKALGKFKSSYPEGIKGNRKGIVKESKKEGAIAIFADVDFIHDQFAFKKSFLGAVAANDNSTLFINAVDVLAGDADLMKIRSKGKISRSFDVINQIEFDAQKRTAGKVKEINASIGRFQAELNQLGRKATEGNIALLQNEGLQKKKQLARKIATLKKELREVKREGREKIEGIGKFFQYLNTMFIPLIVVGVGIYFNVRRKKREVAA